MNIVGTLLLLAALPIMIIISTATKNKQSDAGLLPGGNAGPALPGSGHNPAKPRRRKKE